MRSNTTLRYMVLLAIALMCLLSPSQAVSVSPCRQFQDRIDALLMCYLGATDLPAEEISVSVDAMDWETYQTARWEVAQIAEEIGMAAARGELTESDLNTLSDSNPSICTFEAALEQRAATDGAISTYASKSITVADGGITISDTDTKITKNTETSATITAETGFALFNSKTQTNTITVTNSSGSKATISFNYSVDGHSNFSINGSGENSASSYKVSLEAGSSFTITLTATASPLSSATATLNITNITLTKVIDSAEVTVLYDSSLGSVSAGGAAVANGGTISVTAAGVELSASPKQGAQFVAWVDDAYNVLSANAAFTLVPIEGLSVIHAVFTVDTPWFFVNESKHLVEGLDSTIGYVSSISDKTIVLACNATLSQGAYTIPSGITLLIPFSSANSLYTTAPEALVNDTTTPSPYRTLTMARGTNLSINGAMSVSSKINATSGGQRGGGAPCGPCAFVNMEEGSSITVGSGGALYAWGYITGSGSVSAESGSKVYECFQIEDFRGGQATNSMNSIVSGKGVFPVSQYYIQNIQVPLTLFYGATETAYTALYMADTVLCTEVQFIGTSGCMFNLTSPGGSIVKDYDETTDRLIVEINGDMSISNIKLAIKYIMEVTIDSSKFALPINSNITVSINSGTVTANQDLAMLPGTKVTIAKDATFSIASGKKVYIYDSNNWGGYCSTSNVKFVPLMNCPNRTYTRKDSDLLDSVFYVAGTLDASQGALYTTSYGAAINGTAGGKVIITPGSANTTYQATQSSSDISYESIPITSAQLHNGPNRAEAEPEYTTTAEASAETTYNYCTTCDIWHTGSHYTVNFYIGGELADTVHITSGNSVTYNIVNMDTCDYSGYSYDAETGVLTINNLINPETDVHLTLKEIISVTITWDALSYTYAYGAWQPESHTYANDTLSWNNPDNRGYTNPRITITNQSQNVALEAKLTYDNTNASFSGSFSEVGETVLTNGNTVSLPTPTSAELAAGGNKYVVAFALTGKLNRGTAAGTTTVGTIKITISKSTS